MSMYPLLIYNKHIDVLLVGFIISQVYFHLLTALQSSVHVEMKHRKRVSWLRNDMMPTWIRLSNVLIFYRRCLCYWVSKRRTKSRYCIHVHRV